MKTFDDFDQESYFEESYKPFEFRDDKTEEGTLKWLNENFLYNWDNSEIRRIMYRRLLNRYKNVRLEDGDGLFKVSNRDRGPNDRKTRVKVNFFYDYTEQRVAQVNRHRHKVGFIPRNGSEQSDLNNAKACRLLTEFRLEEINFDQILRDQDRKTFLYGHSFCHIYWDDEKGPYKPMVEKLLEKYPDGKIPRLDKNGKIRKEDFLKDSELRVGDVCMEVFAANRVFAERHITCLKDSKHAEHYDYIHKEELKKMYPKKATEIEESNAQTAYIYYDQDQQRTQVPEDMVMVHYFWHKPTKYLPNGAKIIYCSNAILEWIDFPYKHGILPYVEDKDIEVPDDFWGRPFLVNLEQLSKMYDLIQSSIARNQGVASAPKMVFPEGSIDLKKANNEWGALPFKGPVAPQILQHNYVNKGEFELQDRLEDKMRKFSSLMEISEGKVPSGVTAYSAIRYLDEQEYQRASNTIAKRKERILQIYRQVIGLMAQYYTPEDGRTVRILGKNNEYLIKSFKDFNFSKIYDVKIENISSLSNTRTGRIADIIDLNAANQKDPLFGKKEMVGLLDLGLNDAFKEETNYAADTARSILDMILEGEPNIPQPEATDDLIEWYFIFSRHVESPEYKLKTPPEIKMALDKYIETLEYLMWSKGQVNPLFAQKVAQFPKFPMFFNVKAATELQQLVQIQQNPGVPPQSPQRPDQPKEPALDTGEMDNLQKKIQTEIKESQFGQGGLDA